jgi:hypothetical protein
VILAIVSGGPSVLKEVVVIRAGMRTAVAGLVLVATVGAISGCRNGGASKLAADLTVTYTWAGGIVGGLETTEIKGDGTILITRKGKTSGEETLKVSADRVADLVDELEKTGFFRMDDKYAPARPVPDMVSERVDFRDATRSKSVTVISGSQPPEGWGQVVKAVKALPLAARPG